MAHKINYSCNSCEICQPLCPTQTIFFGEPTFVIDADGCIDCGICARVCPENAVLGPTPTDKKDTDSGNEEEEQ